MREPLSLHPTVHLATLRVLAAGLLAAALCAPAPAGASAATLEGCGECHGAMLRRKVVHAAMQRTSCGSCHQAAPGRVGKCKSPASSAWVLTKPQGDLCASCHDEAALASRYKVKHAFHGKCVECHDPHSSDLPKLMRASGKKLCLGCHDSRSGRKDVAHKIDVTKRYVHAALEKRECQDCHDAGHGSALAGLLKRDQPELCYGCHKRQDQYKYTHTAVRQGECLECHDPHSSNRPFLETKPREELCLACHEVEPLLTKSVVHAPVAEGRCLDCHLPHGGDRPAFVQGTGKALCLKCHDRNAPTGKGSVSPPYRVDLSRKHVHAAVAKGECTDCHDPGHSGDYLKLLKKSTVDLCYGCHTRKDGTRYVHGAVRLGDCAVCHSPHSSDNRALLAKATIRETCFTCHQDDVTGRAVIHRPVADGKCEECHGPHGAANRFDLVKGEGKATCYACHKPVDGGKVRHAALDRYGCTGCHDPHGTANRFLLAKKTNDLCIGCHPGQADGRHVTVIVAGGHAVSGGADPRRPDRPFSCASCHNPHGSDSPKLFYYGDSVMQSCDGCHGDKTGKKPELKNVVLRGAPGTPPGAAGGSPGGGSDGAPRPGGGAGEASWGYGWTLWPAVAQRYGVPTALPPWRNWVWPPERPAKAPAALVTPADPAAPAGALP